MSSRADRQFWGVTKKKNFNHFFALFDLDVVVILNIIIFVVCVNVVDFYSAK